MKMQTVISGEIGAGASAILKEFGISKEIGDLWQKGGRCAEEKGFNNLG